MKYTTLLAGEHMLTIDEFFVRMDDTFECLTTSDRITDIRRHIKLFKPTIFVACIKETEIELARTLNGLEAEFEKEGMTFVLIGEKEDITAFVSQCYVKPDVTLERPLTNTVIRETIITFQKQKEERILEEQRRKEEQEQALRDSKKHILVVDDDPNMLKTIKSQLEDKYNVATAIDGSLALRFLTKKSTDLILLDFEMPGQGGDTVFSILQRNESTKNIPVIFLTGVTDPAKIAKVLALKPQGYLLKPVNGRKLRQEIMKAFGETGE